MQKTGCSRMAPSDISLFLPTVDSWRYSLAMEKYGWSAAIFKASILSMTLEPEYHLEASYGAGMMLLCSPGRMKYMSWDRTGHPQSTLEKSQDPSTHG